MSDGTYEPIATTTLGSTQTSYTFSNISQAYTDLVLVVMCKDARVVGGTDFFVGVGNGSIDTAGNYYYTSLDVYSGSARSIRSSGNGYFYFSMGGEYYGVCTFNFSNYTNTNIKKSVIWQYGTRNGAAGAMMGYWNSTSAINTIKITGEQGLVSGSTFTLYGIKAA